MLWRKKKINSLGRSSFKFIAFLIEDLPKELMFVMEEKENYDIIDNDVEKIKQHIKERI